MVEVSDDEDEADKSSWYEDSSQEEEVAEEAELNNEEEGLRAEEALGEEEEAFIEEEDASDGFLLHEHISPEGRVRELYELEAAQRPVGNQVFQGDERRVP